jgi:hypothetical protein
VTLPSMLLELDAADLRHLAALIEAQSPEARARGRLTDEGRAELFDMLCRGDRPSIGWWRRHLGAESQGGAPTLRQDPDEWTDAQAT